MLHYRIHCDDCSYTRDRHDEATAVNTAREHVSWYAEHTAHVTAIANDAGEHVCTHKGWMVLDRELKARATA